jgi:hypothetical protein
VLNYLLAPTFQFTNTAGRPLSGGAYLEVYIHGTRTKYYCASDFEGNLHPFQIPLDSLGANVVLAEDTGTYDVYAYNRFGSMIMSRYNVKPGAGGSGMGSITSSDGSIEVTPTSTGVDLKVNGQDPSVIRATADDLDADGSFTFSALVIEGQDLSVDEHGRIRMEDGWYHYDATVKLVWEGSVNDSAAVQLYTTLNSDVMDFDLSYAHDETVQLGGEMKITTGGTSFVLGVSGLPSGMTAQLVDLGIHTITGHGDAAGYEAGDGIVIDDHEISVDPTYVQEKLTAGDNITISDNVISATSTTYTAGANVQISNENVISATDTTYTAGTGLDLNGTEFSVDTSEIQEKLTAGSNIVIEGNTISATAEPQLQADWAESDSSSVQYIQNKPDLSMYATNSDLTAGLATKQDTISDLATIRSGSALGATATQPSDLSAGLATKQDVISDLATIRSGAALGATAVQPGDLATVATTGSYDDLTDKPVIPAAQEQADWTESDSSDVSYIKNKPAVKPVVAGSNITITEGNDAITISATATQQVQADWNEVDTSDPSYIQNKPDLSVYATTQDMNTALAGKQDVISDLSTIRSGAALGATSVQPSDLATVATTGDYGDLLNTPTVDQTYDATSTNAQSGVAVASAIANSGLFEATYGTTTLAAVQNAISAHKIVYCRVSGRMAFLAYIGVSKVEFQYYRSNSNGTGDSVFVYTVDSLGWNTTERPAYVQSDWNTSSSSEASYIQNKPDLSVYATESELTAGLATKQDTLTAGSNITITNNVISATAAPQEQADWNESDTAAVDYIKNKPSIPTKTSDITNDSGFITTADVPGAQTQADWAETDSSDPSYINNKPNLATVATTGSYSDLSNTPSIPTATSDLTNDSGYITLSDVPAQVQSDWTESDSSDPSYIANKPSLATVATTGAYSDLSGAPSIPTKTSDLTNDSNFITLADVPAQVQADWTESDSSDPSYIANKPTLAAVATSGDYTDLSNTPHIPVIGTITL